MAAPRDPARLSAEDLAAVLTAAGPAKVTADEVRASRAPTNADGTYHLVHVVAWLAGEIS